MDKVTVEEYLVKERKFMMYIAYKFVKNNYHDAEDLVSEATILALKTKNKFYESTYKFTTWIKYVIMTARQYFKNGRWKVIDTIDLSLSIEDDDKNIEEFDGTNTILMSEIQSLPFPSIAMWRFMGYKTKEIVEFTGTSCSDIERKVKANKEYYNELTRIS